MNKIYYATNQKQKLKYIYKTPLCSKPQQIILKKVYKAIYNLLLIEFPTVLADLINEYITDIIILNVCAKIHYADIENDMLIIRTVIKSTDVVIGFDEYKFSFEYDYNVNHAIKYSLGVGRVITENNIIDSKNYELMPLFNFYMQKIYNKENYMKYIFVKNEYYNYTLHDKVIDVTGHGYNYFVKILDHKGLKNIIVILRIIINTINNSLQCYCDKNKLHEFLNVYYKI